MMYQFSQATDLALEGWERDLDRVTTNQERLQKEFDGLWEAIFRLFDKEGLSGQPARFIAKDGYVLSRVIAQGNPTLDAAATLAAIRALPLDAKAIAAALRAVTDAPVKPERPLNQDKLAAAIERGLLPRDVVKLATPKPQARRVRRKASKEDAEWLATKGLSELAEGIA